MANVIRLTRDEFEEISQDSAYKDPINLLLQCDKKRFGDNYVYPEERFSKDVNNGHWDLWTDEKNIEKFINDFPEEFPLGGEYYAFDPSEDIKDEAIVAIDFGTSATVVVVSSDKDERRPLAIDASVDNNKVGKRYENPTIMQLVDLDTFLKMYSQRDGRPFTKWEHVNVANTASEDFKDAAADDYYAFLHQLKQWAGDNKKTIKFKPKKGDVIELPPYLDIKDGEFDPIELYAYYIGLNINRLKTNSIYLKYYLSFPASFKEPIKRKITQSFENGLQKSLPLAVLRNSKKMESFSVNPNISEPLAYASCVLKEYKIRPKEGQDKNYAIFDFGGGTTDFNFGKWKKYTDSINYSYEIENLGSEGLDVLGGENLLEGLAFEIFKENMAFMKSKNFFFQKGPESKEFTGCEDVLDDKSQFAARNMKRLMEALRKYWEKPYFYNFRVIKNLIKNPDTEIDNETLLSIVQSECAFYIENREKDPNAKQIIQQLQELYEKCLNCDPEENPQTNKMLLIGILENEPDYSSDNDDRKIILKIELADHHGDTFPNQELQTTEDFIFEYFEKKIRKGIVSFFSAIDGINKFHEEENNNVLIFLAGNSCKSPITTTLFKQAIKDNTTSNINFTLYYPLGSIEAYKKMKDAGIQSKYVQGEGPTGKTGVAFGLIDCSEEQGVVYITDGKVYDSNFKYFLGRDDDDYFAPYTFVDVEDSSKKIVGKPEKSRWYRIEGAKADRSSITMYAMANSDCKTKDILISGNVDKKIPIRFPVQDKNLCVFIKVSDANKFDCALATAEEKNIEKNKKGDFISIDLTTIGD